MIEARIFKKKGIYKGFCFSGHAGYAKKGEDVVCSAVSMLVINTANAIEALTENKVKGIQNGYISFDFTDEPDEKGVLLMDAMLMGLKDVEKKYGSEYLNLTIEEV